MDPPNTNKILDMLVKIIYNTYGKTTLFSEREISVLIKNGFMIFYRAQSNFVNSEDYLYYIQVRRCEISKNSNMIKKCHYCSKRCCNYKLDCCKNTTHFQCYIENMCKCCNDLKLNSSPSECVVCFDICETNTKCNHVLCHNCFTTIKDQHKNPSCPICRQHFNKYKIPNDEIWRSKVINEDHIFARISYF